jgi:hypothetical protein
MTTMKKRYLIAGCLALLCSPAFAQSPPPPKPPVADPPRLESRGEPNDQQLLEWQRQRAEEYQRRLREYLATIARMA